MQNKKGSARKMECTDKEWQHCRVEKMGCTGCYYDDIEVGNYVRTRGIIGKLIRIEFDKVDTSLKWYVLDVNKSQEVFVNKPYIEKWSKNITDLIEIGDILEIKEGNDICYLGLGKDTITVNYTDIKESIENKKCELLSILTHEQFEQNSYKV